MKQLYRSRRKKVLTGLCGGLSDYFNVDASLLRILVIIVAVCTSGAPIIVYILASIVIPKEQAYNDFPPGGYGSNPHGGGDFYGGYGGGGAGSHDPQFGRNRDGGSFGGEYRNPPRNDGGQAAGQWKSDNSSSDLDKMMDELEKKALRKELDELKSKLQKYEKGE